MPPHPSNGIHKIGGKDNDKYKSGDLVPSYSVLVTSCDRGYKTSPPQESSPICMNQRWTPSPHYCSRNWRFFNLRSFHNILSYGRRLVISEKIKFPYLASKGSQKWEVWFLVEKRYCNFWLMQKSWGKAACACSSSNWHASISSKKLKLPNSDWIN